MTYDNANDVVNELLESLLLRYQIALAKTMFLFRFCSISLLQILQDKFST